MYIRKIILLFVFVMLCGVSMSQGITNNISSSQDKSSRVTECYLNGKWSLEVEGDPVKAGSYFATVLTIDSMHAPTHYEIAGIMRDKDKAIKHIERATEVDSTNVTYLYLLSSLYAETGDLTKAIKVGERILSLEGDLQKSYLYLISLKAMNKQQDEALKMIDSVKVKFGDSEELDDYKIEIMSSMPATEEVIKNIEDMIVLAPDNMALTVLLGNKYMLIGQDSIAEKIYKDVLSKEPDNIRAKVSLFDMYNAKDDRENVLKLLPSIFAAKEIIVNAKIDIFVNVLAKDEYYQTEQLNAVIGFAKTLIEQYPDNYDIIKLYVQEMIFANRIDDAIYILKKSVNDEVGGIRAAYGVIQLEEQRGNYAAAVDYCDTIIDKYPNERAALISTKSYLLTKNGQIKLAVEMLKTEAKESKDNKYKSYLYTNIGDTYSISFETTKAIENYKKAISYDQSNIIALNNYAYRLSEEGHDLEKALSMALMVINKEPSNPTYLDTYAWILYKMGRFDEAQKAMSKAIALDTTNNSTLLLHYGDIMEKLNQKVVAEKYWKKALEAGADIAEIEKRIK
ncbi:MAG: tetratricopeptide repeat protein [Rikenellaceae bacterium]